MTSPTEAIARLEALAANPLFICRMNGKEADAFALDIRTLLAELAEARKVIAQTNTGYEKLLREWMYTPFPREAQALGVMSPPCGPFAKAAEDIARASEFIRRVEGK